KTVNWTDPEQLPGAKRCKVVEYKDGSPPFYGCEMNAGSCKTGEQAFLALVKDVSLCINAPPRIEDDGKKKTARMHKGGVPVRVQYTPGTACQLRFFVEPLKP